MNNIVPLGSANAIIETLIRDYPDGGTSILDMCKTWGINYMTFLNSVKASDELSAAWAAAKQARAQAFVEDALKISDNRSHDIHEGKPNPAAVARDALRVKTRLHIAGALDPAYRQTGAAVGSEAASGPAITFVIGDSAKVAAMHEERMKRAALASHARVIDTSEIDAMDDTSDMPPGVG